jgi:hypothetical protein
VADHLLIDGIPAVTSEKKVVAGTLYCPLEINQDGRTINPVQSHQCWWIGEPPCDHTGRVVSELISNPAAEEKGDGIRTTVAFSRKPGGRSQYTDFYEKIWTYVKEIWHEARVLNEQCDPRADKPVPAVVEAQKRIFHYPDMATTKAGIGAATAKLLAKKVAIIGIGGTGSYILDLVAKTPVAELHIFDGDVLKLHNAFRAPGAPSKADLTEPKKVDWFGSIYDRMRAGIVRHPYHVDAGNIGELAGFDFVFVAVDKVDARRAILEGLVALKVRFVDVGMELELKGTSIRGMCRATDATPECHEHLRDVVSFGASEEDELYRNIQVADLNMINAALAVIKWKKMCGFYADDLREHHSQYNVPTHALTKDFKK